MKNYCTQNNGICTTCSLNNYGRDCKNVEVDDIADSVSYQAEIRAMLDGIKGNITRIEDCGINILSDNINKSKIEMLQKISGQLHTLNIL